MRMRSLLIVVVVLTVVAWWLMDQPKRREKVIGTTKRVGGVVQLDDEYLTERKAPSLLKAHLSHSLEYWLSTGFAHDVSVTTASQTAIPLA